MKCFIIQNSGTSSLHPTPISPLCTVKMESRERGCQKLLGSSRDIYKAPFHRLNG